MLTNPRPAVSAVPTHEVAAQDPTLKNSLYQTAVVNAVPKWLYKLMRTYAKGGFTGFEYSFTPGRRGEITETAMNALRAQGIEVTSMMNPDDTVTAFISWEIGQN